jgi:VanZ family protein
MQAVFFWKPYQRPRVYSRAHWYVSVWLPVVLAVGVICVESTNFFSAKNTSGWLRPIAEHLFGRFSDLGWNNVHHVLRKTGHFTGYGTLGFTFLRAWLHTLGERAPSTVAVWRAKACLYAVLSTAFVASCDEVHQAFLPDRTGAASDVLLDSCGAVAMCVLVWLACWAGRSSSDVDP